MSEMDQVGSKILFENDRVRIWDFHLDPGELSHLHTHKHDHFYVYISKDNHISFRSPGSGGYELVVPEGYVAYHDVGENPPPLYTHQIKNTGETFHRQLVVEFLGPSRVKDAQPMQSNDVIT